MKLMSYSIAGRDTWGAVVDGGVVELAGRTGHATLAAFIASPDFARRDALLAGLASTTRRWATSASRSRTAAPRWSSTTSRPRARRT